MWGFITSIFKFKPVQNLLSTVANKYTAKGIGYVGASVLLYASYIGMDSEKALIVAYALNGVEADLLKYAIYFLVFWLLYNSINLLFRKDDINKHPIYIGIKHIFVGFTKGGRALNRLKLKELELQEKKLEMEIHSVEKEIENIKNN